MWIVGVVVVRVWQKQKGPLVGCVDDRSIMRGSDVVVGCMFQCCQTWFDEEQGIELSIVVPLQIG